MFFGLLNRLFTSESKYRAERQRQLEAQLLTDFGMICAIVTENANLTTDEKIDSVRMNVRGNARISSQPREWDAIENFLLKLKSNENKE
jgi:hypothetical protein